MLAEVLHPKFMPKFALALALPFMAFSITAEASVIYDVTADFSSTSNPNGPWSFNAGSTPLTIFGNLYNTGAGWYSPGPTPLWEIYPGGTSAGDLVVHSTSLSDDLNNTHLGNVTWTSPGSGTIDILGQAWDAYHDPGRDDEWRLSLNGTIIAACGSIYGINKGAAAAQFSNNLLPSQTLAGIPVAEGDVLKFEVQNTTYPYGHFSGLQLNVTHSVPEPGSAALVSLFLGAATVFRWRKRAARCR